MAKGERKLLTTTITGPQAEALRLVMDKCLTFRAKKVAGKTVMEVYVGAKDWPFHKNPFDKNKNNEDDVNITDTAKNKKLIMVKKKK
jgi:hypothetical protein